MRVFIGYDPRQPLAYNVLQHSIHRHASKPVAITPLQLRYLPITRRGLTDFTYSRYLVPYLAGYEGLAVFMDSDIVVRGDIAELFAQADGSAVQVNQEQARFEWASVMLFDCAQCKILTPEYVNDESNDLYKLKWAESVGKFSPEWNHCVGYAEPKSDAKLYHFTQGIPCWYETAGLPEDPTWHEEFQAMNHTVSWRELMANSVHAKPTLQRMLAKLGATAQ